LQPGEIQNQIKRLNEARGKLVSVAEKKAALAPFQQGQINKLLDQLANNEIDPNFIHTLAQLDKRERDLKNGKRETTTMTVLLTRAPLEHLSAVELYRNIEANRQKMAQDRARAQLEGSQSSANEHGIQAHTESGHVSSGHVSSTQTRTTASSKLDNTTENTEFSDEKSDCVALIPLMEEQKVQNRGLYTARTTYSASETSTLPPPRDKGFIGDLAAELFKIVESHEPETGTLNRISDILPGLLRAFALKGMQLLMPFLVVSELPRHSK
jgi:hypothetical protein